MLVFMGVPIIGFVVYDIVKKRIKKEDGVDAEKAEMAAELERLRALAGEAVATDVSSTEPDSPPEAPNESE